MIDESIILHEIQKRGNWQVIIRPLSFEKERISHDEARRLIGDAQVGYRAWKYPNYLDNNSRDGGVVNRKDSIECIIDHSVNKEIWRMYQSGQYFHRFSFREDRPNYDPSNKVLDILNTLYKITEIFQFASNLSYRHNMFDGGVAIRLSLLDLSQRKLIVFNPLLTLFDEYLCYDQSLDFNERYSKQNIVAEAGELALECIVWLFKQFNWQNPDLKKILRSKQEDLTKSNQWSY